MDNDDDKPRLTQAAALMLGFAAGPIIALLTYYFLLLNRNYPRGLAISAGEGLTRGPADRYFCSSDTFLRYLLHSS